MTDNSGRTAVGAQRELRLALAMRGGVSLSVWIGGACCEIDELRTAEHGQGFWTRLLRASDYRGVAVDVIAGASAGGLNGVIFAAAQQYGFKLDRLRDLWIEVGDTDGLLRRKQDARADGWPSLFRGDGYFFARARSELVGLAQHATPPAPPPPLTLTLSATLVEPVRRAGRSPSDEALTELRFASGFVFEQPYRRWLPSDFDHEGDDQGHVWSRLALAARSTSSFPAAFEAARVRAVRPRSFTVPAESTGQGLEVDMGGVFADRGSPDGVSREFLVSDGGILDNIPLGRALDAIAHAAADGPTDRYLIYVQPGAPAPAPAGAGRGEMRERRASFNVLRGVLSARLPNEDIIADLAEIDAFNTRVARAQSLRRSGFGGLRDQEALLNAAEGSWAGYRVLRSGEDQRLVSALLDDPLKELKEDPFPSEVGGQAIPDDRWRSPLDASGAPLLDRDRLAVALSEAFLERLPEQFQRAAQEGQVVTVGALPLMRITQLLIEWAQYLETVEPLAGVQKAKLYRVASFIHEAIDHPRRLGWVTLAATVPSDRAEQDLWQAAGVLSDLMLVTDAEAAGVCAGLIGEQEDTDTLRDALAGRFEVLESIPARAWGGEPASQVHPLTDIRAAILREVLVPIAQDLQGLRPNRAAGPADPPGAYLNQVLDGEIGCSTLEALEVVAYQEFAAGLPGRRPVRFRRLSAANPTPLASRFTALLDAAEQPPGRWWDPAQTERSRQEGIHVNLKLAGNELANFSAFLRDDWRRNDWMWGRLDAVPTLVDLLLASDRFNRGPGTPTADADIEDLVAGTSAMREFILEETLDTEVRQDIRAELATPSGPMPALRRALVAARQWEILAQELGVGDGSQLLDIVAAYDTGAQTIRTDAVSGEIHDKLDRIIDVVGDVVLYCGQLRLGEGFLGTPEDPSWQGRGVHKLIEFLGSHAVDHMTDD